MATHDDEPREAVATSRKRKRKRKKPKASPAAGILGGIGGLLLLAVFLLIITGKWVDLIVRPVQRLLEDAGIHPLLAIAITAAVFLIPLGILALHWIKSSIVAALPVELEFAPATLEEFPRLDMKRLKRDTEAYAALGFRPLMDYQVQTELESSARGFARLLVLDGEHCYAEINQGFGADGDPIPMRSMVVSHLDGGWSLATSNRAPSKELFLMRRRKAAWRSLPEAKPDGLLQDHLKLRRKMIGDLNLKVAAKDSVDAYFERERQAARERKQAVASRWALAIVLDLWLFDKNPKNEWLGDYRA
jgi:hypothetical protein